MDTLLGRYGINTKRIRYDVVPEDYPLLLSLMQMEHDKYLPTVKTIIRKHDGKGDQLKAELKRLVQTMPLSHPVTILDGDYAPERFYALAKGLEQEPERGARCQKCIGHRLEETFRAAAALEVGPDFVCTTRTISPHKDAVWINTRGAELAEQYGIPWLYTDFKKKGGYQRSIALSREYDLYRQNFCGCVYSRLEAERREQQHNS